MPETSDHAPRLDAVMSAIHDAARAANRPVPQLVAVAKTRSAAEARHLCALRRARGDALPALGENYVQEAATRVAALPGEAIEWHLIGHLQSNKTRQAAELFDWVQTVDRPKLVGELARHRAPGRAPLNVLIQVNIDDETSKHGCRPEDIHALADAAAAQPRLRLRGLMAIPAPHPQPEARRAAFARMRALFEDLGARHPEVDTLSMGMSDDFPLAIAEGATLVRIGTALFGARSREPGMGNGEP